MISIADARTHSDLELLSAAASLARAGRESTADLIALLVVLDQRRVYAAEGYSSLFAFCVKRLRLSEEETFYRIAAARVAGRVPSVLDRLREGRLTLTAVALLRKHLTEENEVRILEAAEGRSKREVQQLAAALAPAPDVPASVRKLPARRAAGSVIPKHTEAPPAAAPVQAWTFVDPAVRGDADRPSVAVPDVPADLVDPTTSTPGYGSCWSRGRHRA